MMDIYDFMSEVSDICAQCKTVDDIHNMTGKMIEYSEEYLRAGIL